MLSLSVSIGRENHKEDWGLKAWEEKLGELLLELES